MTEAPAIAEPERLDLFMARANAAYYANRDPFADFITAPEIAQAFGELLGAWAAVVWQAMGRPDPMMLAEAGPGRGTLMADALRLAARVAPEFARAARVHLVETSPRLRAIQAAALAGSSPTWHDTIDTIPDGPLILIGNEFLDALPIRQVVLTPDGWRERFVRNGTFVLGPTDLPTPGVGSMQAEGMMASASIAPTLAASDLIDPLPLAGDRVAGDGDVPSPVTTSPQPMLVVERCEPALAIVAALAHRIVRSGGAVLLLDYGPDQPGAGDTLQALRDGQPAAPLDEPGSADLTAHVDFPALREVAMTAGAAVHGPEGQGAFLSALGLFQRTERLMRDRPPAQARAFLDAAHRLAAPERMGRLFKAMALCHPSLGVPPGFPVSSSAAETSP